MPINIRKLFSEQDRRSVPERLVRLADKTAFGYVKNYFEERGQEKELAKLTVLFRDVPVSEDTGQHPGGIIVLPMGKISTHSLRCSIRQMI